MLKQFATYFKHLLTLSEETQRNTRLIEKLQEQVRLLTIEIEKIKIELRMMREREQYEREVLMLRLENRILRVERGLKPGDEANA